MKIRDIILGILCVSIMGLSGFCYMLWETKENLKVANDKTVEGLINKIDAMQLDLDNKDEYIEELKLNLNLRDQLIEEMNQSRYEGSEFGTESDNQKIIFSELGGEMEKVLEDGTRVDLVFEGEEARGPSMRACEIDWATKWAEGVGQAVYYTVKLNEPIINGAMQSDGPLNVDDVRKLHMPVVILLAKGADSGWEKYRDRAELCERIVRGMRVWVFDAETKTWLDKD